MKPLLVELMGEFRERRQERGEPAPTIQALRRAYRGPGYTGCSADEAALISPECVEKDRGVLGSSR
jgi:hypothetical protein